MREEFIPIDHVMSGPPACIDRKAASSIRRLQSEWLQSAGAWARHRGSQDTPGVGSREFIPPDLETR